MVAITDTGGLRVAGGWTIGSNCGHRIAKWQVGFYAFASPFMRRPQTAGLGQRGRAHWMDVQSVRDAVPSPLVGERLQLHSSEEHTSDGTVRDAVVDIVS
jgi:hypothetical protein